MNGFSLKLGEGPARSLVDPSSAGEAILTFFQPSRQSLEKQVLLQIHNGSLLLSGGAHERLREVERTFNANGDVSAALTQRSIDMDALLIKLVTFGDTKTEFSKQGESTTGGISAERCVSILEELNGIGWKKVHELNEDFSSVTFQVLDEHNRSHFIKVNTTTYECSTDWSPLPFPPSHSLKDTVHRVEEQIRMLSVLWDELDHLDQSCKVVDPPLPAPRSVLRRRLALFGLDGVQVKNVFLEVYLSPHMPTASPCSVNFVGLDSSLTEWRHALDQYEWNSKLNIFENIQKMFQHVGNLSGGNISQPSDQITIDAEELVRECGVCYSYRLTDPETNVSELPDDCCPKCFRPYHHSCILGWLRALPLARKSFNLIVGECPYCGQDMTVKDA